MFFQGFLSGFTLGCIYALVALGFVLIYKTTEVVNFAQGEFMTLGAFIALSLITSLKLHFIIALPITFLAAMASGLLLERVMFRKLIGEEPFALIMVTIGLSIGLRSVIGMVWTYDTLSFPSMLSRNPVKVMNIVTTPLQLGIIATTLMVVLLLYLFFKYTRTGVAMQATAQNQLGAYLMGVNVERMFSLVWGISCVLGAVAGILLAPIIFLNHDMGFIGIKAFPAAVLGGLSSIPGAIIGGLIIGVAESMAGLYLPHGFKEIFPYLILFLVLIIRPEGIFGIQERKKV
ncbi:MAG: branched-chain amino acid ABC transporter permease [Pseudomonadota bacterium]